jgi:uncharacterized lipoprotein YehR (DUF1307 family)
MKNKLIMLLVFVLILSITLIGCGAKEELEEALNDVPTDVTTIGEADIENMLGIEGNDSGELREVTMTEEELKEVLSYKSYKVTQDYTDEYSIVYDYSSKADIDDLVDHYESLVINTEEYSKIQPAGFEGAMLQGMINETAVYIEIDNSNGGMPTVATYIDLTSKK